jgi:hypothetical protein
MAGAPWHQPAWARGHVAWDSLPISRTLSRTLPDALDATRSALSASREARSLGLAGGPSRTLARSRAKGERARSRAARSTAALARTIGLSPCRPTSLTRFRDLSRSPASGPCPGNEEAGLAQTHQPRSGKGYGPVTNSHVPSGWIASPPHQ